jgi:hypothetical protein
MAFVRTFRITRGVPGGVPDKEVADWLSKIEIEENAILSVQTVLIPPMGNADARLTVIATKLDHA